MEQAETPIEVVVCPAREWCPEVLRLRAALATAERLRAEDAAEIALMFGKMGADLEEL